MTEELVIIKLGGAAITDKTKPFTLRPDIIKQAIKEIKESGKKCIIIHGAGSFAHNLALEYKLARGRDDSLTLEEQFIGITKIRRSLQNLHNAVLDAALDVELNVFTVPISATFVSDGPLGVFSHYFDVIDTNLSNNFIPITYGDIVFDKQSTFRVISGDRIIRLLCHHFSNMEFPAHVRIIFGSNVDGLYDKDPKFDDAKLIVEIHNQHLNRAIDQAGKSAGTDITGGMKGKLEEIKPISDLGYPVQIVNIMKEDRLFDILMNNEVTHTVIHPN